MTCNVFSGTLNPAQSRLSLLPDSRPLTLCSCTSLHAGTNHQYTRKNDNNNNSNNEQC